VLQERIGQRVKFGYGLYRWRNIVRSDKNAEKLVHQVIASARRNAEPEETIGSDDRDRRSDYK
jgi:hypothetical protein